MHTAVSKGSVVCANCGERFVAPRHSNQHRRTGGRSIESARYCSPACRQAAYVARRAIRAGVPHSGRHKPINGSHKASDGRKQSTLAASVTNAANSPAGPTTLPASVTNAPLAPIRQRNTDLGIVAIVRDAEWSGMYRLRFPDGRLSDMVNLTRAKDALAAMKGAAT
jgi:hypothetical protein